MGTQGYSMRIQWYQVGAFFRSSYAGCGRSDAAARHTQHKPARVRTRVVPIGYWDATEGAEVWLDNGGLCWASASRECCAFASETARDRCPLARSPIIALLSSLPVSASCTDSPSSYGPLVSLPAYCPLLPYAVAPPLSPSPLPVSPSPASASSLLP